MSLRTRLHQIERTGRDMCQALNIEAEATLYPPSVQAMLREHAFQALTTAENAACALDELDRTEAQPTRRPRRLLSFLRFAS